LKILEDPPATAEADIPDTASPLAPSEGADVLLLSIDVVGFHAVLTTEVFGVLFRLMRRQSIPERSQGHDGEAEGAWLPLYGKNIVQRQPLQRSNLAIGV